LKADYFNVFLKGCLERETARSDRSTLLSESADLVECDKHSSLILVINQLDAQNLVL